MTSKGGTISAEEFNLWLTPLQAQQALRKQWDFGTIRSTLAGRVGHGLLGARAEIMIMRPGRSDEA